MPFSFVFSSFKRNEYALMSTFCFFLSFFCFHSFFRKFRDICWKKTLHTHIFHQFWFLASSFSNFLPKNSGLRSCQKNLEIFRTSFFFSETVKKLGNFYYYNGTLLNLVPPKSALLFCELLKLGKLEVTFLPRKFHKVFVSLHSFS